MLTFEGKSRAIKGKGPDLDSKERINNSEIWWTVEGISNPSNETDISCRTLINWFSSGQYWQTILVGVVVLTALMIEVLPEPFSPTNNIILGDPDLINSAQDDSRLSRPIISSTLDDSIGRPSKGLPRNEGIESSDLPSNTIIAQ